MLIDVKPHPINEKSKFKFEKEMKMKRDEKRGEQRVKMLEK